MKIIMTNEQAIMKEWETELVANPKAEMQLVKSYPAIGKQTIVGFGGALTEASAYVWDQMDSTMKDKLIDLYFGKNGNGYNLCRTHIQSCDFGLGNRAYVNEGDTELRTFSIDEDRMYQIPMIKAAMEKGEAIEFLASPWSPPAFMKTNNQMNRGGKLLEAHYGNWAAIMVEYLLAYREEGIVIQRVTVQNEPAAVQSWDSCVYTAEEEKAFAVHYLRKALDEKGLQEVKILVWDHNKDLIIERAMGILDDEEGMNAVDGVAFHWYSGDHFEALSHVHELYPDKELLFTEGCVEYSRFEGVNQTQNAIMYAHDMIGNLKAGMNGFIDWNILLDEQGGPNHVGNFCDAPIMYNTKNGTLDIKLSYYFIGHFSRYIQKGARRMLTSSYSRHIESVGFVNPDGTQVIVLLNTSNQELPFEYFDGHKAAMVDIEGQSIMTLVINPSELN